MFNSKWPITSSRAEAVADTEGGKGPCFPTVTFRVKNSFFAGFSVLKYNLDSLLGDGSLKQVRMAVSWTNLQLSFQLRTAPHVCPHVASSQNGSTKYEKSKQLFSCKVSWRFWPQTLRPINQTEHDTNSQIKKGIQSAQIRNYNSFGFKGKLQLSGVDENIDQGVMTASNQSSQHYYCNFQKQSPHQWCFPITAIARKKQYTNYTGWNVSRRPSEYCWLRCPQSSSFCS